MSPQKQEPLGICDNCGEPFPSGVSPFTSKGAPRLCCSKVCTNARNSQIGAPIRSRKARERVKRGEWKNPSPVMSGADEGAVEEWRQRVGAGVARRRKAEVEAGVWRNPADSPQAREKLSRLRKHTDDPVLHSAISKLSAGASMAGLSDEEAEAHRAHRRELYQARSDEMRARAREQYRAQASTEEGRARLRAKWQRQKDRLALRQPNHRLAEARQAAGLSQADLAEMIGSAQTTVSKWERVGAVPRDAGLQRRVAAILGVCETELWERN